MTNAHGVARDQLRAFVERIERLEEEKKTIADDIKDVYGEAKAMGFDTKILKKVISLRKKDEQERSEEEMILDTYLAALGMLQHDLFEDEPAPATREDRAKRRTSEAMADHKSLVDEMADAGLISEEARHENKALADAVATKFGNSPAMALQSPRKAAEAVSERTANHTETDAAISRPEFNQPEIENRSGREAPEADASGGMQDEVAIHPATPIASASQGEAEAPTGSTSGPNEGGSHVDASISAATHQAGSDIVRTPRPATSSLRPNCRNPGEACGGYGSKHCWSCEKSMREGDAA